MIGHGVAPTDVSTTNDDATLAASVEAVSVPVLPAKEGGRVPVRPGEWSGYWIVDPGIAKQSQDWICVGPGERHASPLPRRGRPPGLAAAAGFLTLFLALALLAWPSYSAGLSRDQLTWERLTRIQDVPVWLVAWASHASMTSLPSLMPPALPQWTVVFTRLTEHPVAGGLLAATALYAAVLIVRVVRRLGSRRVHTRKRAAGATASPTDGADTGRDSFDPNMTYTEAVAARETGAAQSSEYGQELRETRAGSDAREATQNGVRAPAENGHTYLQYESNAGHADQGVQSGNGNGSHRAGWADDDADLTYDVAAQRQAWEGPIAIEPPVGWPDRPLVLAIGDGVSSGLRSAEISRLATRTAWERTYFHLHTLSAGTVPPHEPWLMVPDSWPTAGPARDQLLIQAMTRAFADANNTVIETGKEHRRLNPAESRATATTLSLVAVDDWRCFLVHVGDCSVYHVQAQSGEIEARQVEHNKAGAFAQGDPNRHLEARRQGLQNVLTRWVGMTTNWAVLDPQVLKPPFEIAPGDSLVLCSDGLDKHVHPAGIARAALALDAEPATRRLVRLANDRGGSDHVAVAVIRAGKGVRRGVWAARRAIWREDLAIMYRKNRGDAIGLALAGAVVTLLGSAALFLPGTLASETPATQLPTPTALPTASPVAPPPVAAAVLANAEPTASR
jgi:serine/threonine protein phosphatase PrpC